MIRYDGNEWQRINHPLNDSTNYELIHNVKAGEPCPQSGFWFTTAKRNSRKYFSQGDIFPDFKSDWGDVYWQFEDNK